MHITFNNENSLRLSARLHPLEVNLIAVDYPLIAALCQLSDPCVKQRQGSLQNSPNSSYDDGAEIL